MDYKLDSQTLDHHYPARACTAGVKQCRHVCVCWQKKILKNTSSRVARATESHWNVSLPDTSQGGSFSATSSYRFLGDSIMYKYRRANSITS